MALVALTGTFEMETTALCQVIRNNKSYTIDYNHRLYRYGVYIIYAIINFPFNHLDCHYGADNLSQIEFDRDHGAMA